MVKSFAIVLSTKFLCSVFNIAIFAIPVSPQQQNYSNYSFGWADDVFYGRLKNESWAHGVIYYDLDPFLTPEMVHAINYVINYFNSLDICMQWLQRIPFSFDDNVKDWISFVHHRDSPTKVFCSSKINRVGGQQQIKLGTFCVEEKLKVPLRLENTVLHEMVHAMGLHHEHQRPDRDCYIYIPPQLAARPRYTRVNGSYFPSGFPYDLYSVMHYPTSQLKVHKGNAGKLGRQNVTLSELDLHKLNHLYCGRKSYCEEHNTCATFYDFAKTDPLCWRRGPTYARDPRNFSNSFSDDEDISDGDE